MTVKGGVPFAAASSFRARILANIFFQEEEKEVGE